MTKRRLNEQQLWWVELLLRYDFVIKHQLGKVNPTNALLRCLDYKLESNEKDS
jgi:hypothetical protein